MLTALPTLSENPTASAREIEDAKARLALFEIDSLRLYENPEGHRVAEITQSLERTGILIDPVIVDPDRRMLIDGHHRVRAFELLGLNRIPAHLVDYESSSVTVRNWSRVTDAPAEILAGELIGQPGVTGGVWMVRGCDGEGRVLAEHGFSDPEAGARYVHHVACSLEIMGFSVGLRPEDDALKEGKAYFSTTPIIGKSEVLDLVSKGKLFPHEVNRHLIDRRPLELDIPVSAMDSESAFRSYLDRLTDGPSLPTVCPSGYRQGNRAYEERVLLFRPGEGAG